MTMGIWRWSDWLIELPADARQTLGEGDTALVRSHAIGPSVGLKNLYFKLETGNPTGSYKDRFAVGAISDMVAKGKRRCIATSSGNTGSALAAYCAVVPQMTCQIAVLEKTPLGKLQQMMAYGAKIYRVRGMGLDPRVSNETIRVLQQLSDRPDTALQISAFRFSPAGMTCVQSISYELAEQIDGRIDHVFSPAGGGGLTLAVARGFDVLVAHGRLDVGAKIECVQPEGNNTMAGPLREGADQAVAVTCTSQISGLQVGSVIDGDETLAACRRTGGTGHVISDEAIWHAQARMAREEGIFCEPAGATSLAGALNACQRGSIDPDATVVCLVTGTGFKDPSSIERMLEGFESPLVNVSDLPQLSTT